MPSALVWPSRLNALLDHILKLVLAAVAVAHIIVDAAEVVVKAGLADLHVDRGLAQSATAHAAAVHDVDGLFGDCVLGGRDDGDHEAIAAVKVVRLDVTVDAGVVVSLDLVVSFHL